MTEFLAKMLKKLRPSKEGRFGGAPTTHKKDVNLDKEAKEFIRRYGGALESLSKK